jgi:hypothetical protein
MTSILKAQLLNTERETRIVDDIAKFAKHQLSSRDIDPAYPVLEALEEHLDPEVALWRTLLYVAWYNLSSSERIFALASTPRKLDRLTINDLCLPTGIERRGLRGGVNMEAHLRDLVRIWEKHDRSWVAWLQQGFTIEPDRNWTRLQETLQEPKFNGRWAAFKMADILLHTHHWHLMAPDMGMAHSSGPRWGLALLFGEVLGDGPEQIELLDVQAAYLRNVLAKERDVHLTFDELETVLCDYHSMSEGRYYVGHDIDEMQEQLLLDESLRGPLPQIWSARARALPHNYLGEIGGWQGRDRARRAYYRRTGKIAIRI